MSDTIEDFINSVSYKFPKGYPDMDDPKDKELLFSLVEGRVNESQLITEGSDVYDQTIKRALGEDEIPKAKGNYKFNGKGGASFEEQVQASDKPTFDKLFNIAPPKVGEEEGQSKGVGNGEIALYWLYNYSDSKVDVEEGRSGDDPDLYFNKVGVEVKAYKSHRGIIGLGRFGSDKENLALLSMIFGVRALNKALGSSIEGPAINPTNFSGKELIPTFKKVLELGKIEDLDSLASKYEVFKIIKSNIEYINTHLDDPVDEVEAAKKLALNLLKYKLGRKPGDGGYLANVLKNGSIKFFAIKFDSLLDSDSLLNDFKVSQSAIKINFDKIFG